MTPPGSIHSLFSFGWSVAAAAIILSAPSGSVVASCGDYLAPNGHGALPFDSSRGAQIPPASETATRDAPAAPLPTCSGPNCHATPNFPPPLPAPPTEPPVEERDAATGHVSSEGESGAKPRPQGDQIGARDGFRPRIDRPPRLALRDVVA